MRLYVLMILFVAVSGCSKGKEFAHSPPRLRVGMSYAEVVEVRGEPYLNLGDAVLRPVWIEPDGRWFAPAFDGDKLATIPEPTTPPWETR